jgi:hypothetical protein
MYLNIATVHTLSEKERQIYFSERIILTPLNIHINDINNVCMERLMGDSRTYLSVDSALDDRDNINYILYGKESMSPVCLSTP